VDEQPTPDNNCIFTAVVKTARLKRYGFRVICFLTGARAMHSLTRRYHCRARGNSESRTTESIRLFERDGAALDFGWRGNDISHAGLETAAKFRKEPRAP
jgi:hypothetical protein